MKQEDARQILEQGHNVLLTGAAGSGKTFLVTNHGVNLKSAGYL